MTSHQKSCSECGMKEDSTLVHQVYEFGDEDGKLVDICHSCYEQHEEKGDWVA